MKFFSWPAWWEGWLAGPLMNRFQPAAPGGQISAGTCWGPVNISQTCHRGQRIHNLTIRKHILETKFAALSNSVTHPWNQCRERKEGRGWKGRGQPEPRRDLRPERARLGETCWLVLSAVQQYIYQKLLITAAAARPQTTNHQQILWSNIILGFTATNLHFIVHFTPLQFTNIII